MGIGSTLQEDLCKHPLKILILGNVIRKGIGDEMVCIPMYYALRYFYPDARIYLLTANSIFLELLKSEDQRSIYVDEVLLIQESQKWENLYFDFLLIVEHNSLEVLKIAHKIQANCKITTFSRSLFLSMGFLYFNHYLQGIKSFVNPYWLQTHNEIQRNLNLIRQINPKIFDKKFPNIDFLSAKLPVLESAFQSNNALLAELKEGVEYSLVVGIFPFAKNTIKKANFALKKWIFLAQSLSEEFSEVLFVIVNYPNTGYHFVSFKQKNLKVFYNQQGLETLIAFLHSLNAVIGVDSGHIHIADNAGIPTLEVIAKKVSRQWSGGFYKGYFDFLVLSSNWKKYEQKNFRNFLKKARGLISYLLNLEKS